MSDAKVWIGCLGCYNGGNLIGEWFDAETCPTDMIEFEGQVTLGRGRGAHALEAHEELWVMDHEGFGDFLVGECSPMEAQRIAGVIADIESDHIDPDAVAAWMSVTGESVDEWDRPTSDAFYDSYQGEWDSEEDFAQNLADDIGAVNADASWPNDCIDWERATRELFMDYSSERVGNGNVFVFRSY